MANPPQQSNQTTKWQDALIARCRDNNLSEPTWQTFSDRRGGRTAWSCQVNVYGQLFSARYFYDGQYINNAKEDAAQVALTKLWPSQTSSQHQGQDPPQQPQQQEQQHQQQQEQQGQHWQ